LGFIQNRRVAAASTAPGGAGAVSPGCRDAWGIVLGAPLCTQNRARCRRSRACDDRRGEWAVDLRDRTAFAAGHLRGSLGFELSTSFVTYLGWLHRWGAPLTLIGDDPEQVAQARRELARIGVDELAGAAVGEVPALADGRPLGAYRVAAFADLPTATSTARRTSRCRSYPAASRR
jgi:hypothetical protein